MARTRARPTFDAGRTAAAADERRAQFFSSREFSEAISEVSWRTDDSFQNFQLQLGMGTDNALSGSTYGFNPITRNRTLLEWMHRGSWLAGAVINLVGDDMTRAGVEVTGDMDPNDVEKLHTEAVKREIWSSANDVVCWARLYGGAIGVLLIDGQDTSKPLRIRTVGRNQFKGILALDRWMVEPSSEIIETLGPDMGLPQFYRVGSNAPGLRGKTVHHSRCLRMDGIRLPYTQRVMENLWGISVLERLYDRMVAFDSATQGAAQLVYKSYIRTYRIKDLRKAIAGPPEMLGQLIQYIHMMRRFQGIEGITLLDAEDEFESQQSARLNGISDALMQFGQQIAGAAQIPLIRLFGMSPTGFNSSGESDLRTYYDGIKQRQERDLRIPIDTAYRVMARSLGIELGNDFGFDFRPLWQMPEEVRAQMASTVANAMGQAMGENLISHATALKELKQSSRITGIFTNISDEDIEDAENEPPPMSEMGGPPGMGMPPGEGAEGDVSGGTTPSERSPGGIEDSLRQGRHLHLVRDSAGSLLVPGLEVVIENPHGSSRYPWGTRLPAHYGFIRGTDGGDGEEADCFVGPEPEAGHDAWAIEQVDPDSGEFDEWKLMLGFPSRRLAIRCYQRAFDDGSAAARQGSITRVPMDDIHAWLDEHARRRAA